MSSPEAAEEARAQEPREDGIFEVEGLTPRRNRSSIPSLLFLSFILFMLTNHHGKEFDARYHYMRALDSLNNQVANYSAWLNGTASNFSLPIQSNATRPLLDSLLTFGTKLDPEGGSYYTNLTGFWHGDVGFYNLTLPTSLNSTWSTLAEDYVASTNLTAFPELLGTWNWTASNKVSFSIGDKALSAPATERNVSGQIAMIHGKVELSDPDATEELRLDFDGVHFVSNGSIYAFAEPTGRHVDLRNVASLVPPIHMNDTAHAVEAELLSRAVRLREKIDAGTIDVDALNNDELPDSRCSFQLYAQLDPTGVPQYLMKELEDEINQPTGISTVKAPELKLQGVLISQNCGMLYEIKDTVGLKSPQLNRKITTYAGIATMVYLVLLQLLLRETARSSSTVALGRMSRYVFLSQSLIDAIAFVGHITLGILADGRPSLAVLGPAGLACILFIMEARFSVSIGQVQVPEDLAPTPPRPTPTLTPPAAPSPSPATLPDTPAISTDTDNSSPATQPETPETPAGATPPPTSARPQQTLLQFLWLHIRTDPSARMWTIISIFLIFVFRIVLILSLPLLFIGSLYSSIWAFQIYRSARRGRGSGLSAEYLVGTTVCRLYFALYFLGCPKNILDVEPRPWIYAEAAFMLVQAFTVMTQDRTSPTFFLGSRLVVAKTYDYHPPLPLPDPEAPEQTLGDCAICMDSIEIDPSLRRRSKSSDGKERGDLLGLATGARRSGGILEAVGAVGAPSSRKNYSLAPCHHLFHTACLERWLAIKNICPQCRRPLPPL